MIRAPAPRVRPATCAGKRPGPPVEAPHELERQVARVRRGTRGSPARRGRARRYTRASTASWPTAASGIDTPCSAIQSISRCHRVPVPVGRGVAERAEVEVVVRRRPGPPRRALDVGERRRLSSGQHGVPAHPPADAPTSGTRAARGRQPSASEPRTTSHPSWRFVLEPPTARCAGSFDGRRFHTTRVPWRPRIRSASPAQHLESRGRTCARARCGHRQAYLSAPCNIPRTNVRWKAR